MESCMIRYVIGIGTNINPHENVLHILRELLAIAPKIQISRVIETIPVGIESRHPFLNFSASFLHTDSSTVMKARFNTIETTLGRDRHDPKRSIKDRPADLDILFTLDETQTIINAEKLPEEVYLRPTTIDLLDYLGITILGERGQTLDGPGIAILTPAGPIGKYPMTIRLTIFDRREEA
jgi:2-amino-4-hydroxy-6-hydroxymethyldihydropteridine diphosphokinase